VLKTIAFAILFYLSMTTVASAACSTSATDTCTAGSGITNYPNGATIYRCDVICGVGTTCGPSTHTACDQCGAGTGGNSPDGKCVICDIVGNTSTHTINGTAGADVICADAGDDTINGNGGDDEIETGSGGDVVNGGAGADKIQGAGLGGKQLYGDDGADILVGSYYSNNIIVGGDGNDTMWGGISDDVLYGGSGNDTLIGGGGADSLNGEAGDDALTPVVAWGDPVPDDVVGARYCGGSGSDSINGKGPDFICVDAGESGSDNDTCRYEFEVAPSRAQASTDFGTEDGCEFVTAGYAFNSSREIDCGCID